MWYIPDEARRLIGQARCNTVFSNSGMSLERPEIGDAKRVDPLLAAAV
jgi:hypothetical protein